MSTVTDEKWQVREVVDEKTGNYEGVEWKCETVANPYGLYFARVTVAGVAHTFGMYDEAIKAMNVSYFEVAQLLPKAGGNGA